MMKKHLTSIGLLLALAFAHSGATAQNYPSRPVTLIVPHGAGGANDVVGRAFGHKLSSRLGQPVVVDNRPGAGGNVGSALVSKGPRDGYTLLMTVGSSHTINPSLYKAPGFDPVKDFEPIALVGTAPYVLVVNPGLPVKSVPELVALAKARPGQINMASAGNGTLDHLLGEMFQSAAGVDMVHVPYKGAAAANVDMLSGQVSVTFTSWPSVMSFVNSGKLRLLAVASEARSPLLPDVPSIQESVPGVSAVSWYGLFAPSGTPAAVVSKLRTEASAVLGDPQFKETLRHQGVEAAGMPVTSFAQMVKSDLQKWAAIVQATGARID